MRKLQLEVNSYDDLEKLRLAIPRLKLQLLQWQAVNIRRLANSIFVDEIHKQMKNLDFSQKIIDGTIIDNIEFRSARKIRLHIKSEYFSDEGFDVALAREKGTRDHFVKPREDPVTTYYSRRDDSGRLGFKKNPNKKKALSWIVGGERFFSKGHMVSGMTPYHVVETIIKYESQRFREAYRTELITWIASNLRGIAVGF